MTEEPDPTMDALALRSRVVDLERQNKELRETIAALLRPVPCRSTSEDFTEWPKTSSFAK